MTDAETLAETLAAGFENRALVQPRAVFVFDGERYVSRGEYSDLADRYASALDELEESRDDADKAEEKMAALESAAAALAIDYVRRFLAETFSPFSAARFYVVSDRGGHLFVTFVHDDGFSPSRHAELADLAAELAARLPHALVTPAFRVTAEDIDRDGFLRWSVTAGVRIDETADARGGEER